MSVLGSQASSHVTETRAMVGRPSRSSRASKSMVADNAECDSPRLAIRKLGCDPLVDFGGTLGQPGDVVESCQSQQDVGLKWPRHGRQIQRRWHEIACACAHDFGSHVGPGRRIRRSSALLHFIPWLISATDVSDSNLEVAKTRLLKIGA